MEFSNDKNYFFWPMNIVYKLIYVFSWHGFYTSSCANFAHTRFTLENCMHSNALVRDSSFYLLSSGLLPLISWMLTLYPETLLNSFIIFVDLLLFYVCITMSLNRNSSASSILGNPFACVSSFCLWLTGDRSQSAHPCLTLTRENIQPLLLWSWGFSRSPSPAEGGLFCS